MIKDVGIDTKNVLKTYKTWKTPFISFYLPFDTSLNVIFKTEYTWESTFQLATWNPLLFKQFQYIAFYSRSNYQWKYKLIRGSHVKVLSQEKLRFRSLGLKDFFELLLKKPYSHFRMYTAQKTSDYHDVVKKFNEKVSFLCIYLFDIVKNDVKWSEYFA